MDNNSKVTFAKSVATACLLLGIFTIACLVFVEVQLASTSFVLFLVSAF